MSNSAYYDGYSDGWDHGIQAASNRVNDYLNSLIDSGRLDDNELRLVENILSHFENALDAANL